MIFLFIKKENYNPNNIFINLRLVKDNDRVFQNTTISFNTQLSNVNVLDVFILRTNKCKHKIFFLRFIFKKAQICTNFKFGLKQLTTNRPYFAFE